MRPAFLSKIRWWPTAIVTLAILWLTLAPHPLPTTDTKWFEGADKVVHAIMFFTLTAALTLDASRYGRHLTLALIGICATCVIAFAAIDEWAQGAMQFGRTSDPYDFLADCIGIFLAALLSLIILKRKPDGQRPSGFLLIS